MDAKGGNRKAVVLVLAVFLLGIALGAVGTYLAGARVWGARADARSATGKRVRLIERLTQELNLSAEQQSRIEAILAAMKAKYQGIHEQMTPQFDQVRQQGRDQIRGVLSSDQRPRFEDFLRRVDEERKRKNGR